MKRSKISSGEWMCIYFVMGALDITQFLIDFTGVGEAVNEFADPVIGGIFALYLQWRGVSMLDRISRLMSILGVTGIEEITFGVAPAWILDVWYIQRSVKQEESELAQAMGEGGEEGGGRQPLNRGGVRLPSAPAAPANVGGVRAPSAPTVPTGTHLPKA